MDNAAAAVVLRGAIVDSLKALHSHIVHKAIAADIKAENVELARQLVPITKGFTAAALGNLTVRQSPIGGEQYVVSPHDQTVAVLQQKLITIARAYKQLKADYERLKASSHRGPTPAPAPVAAPASIAAAPDWAQTVIKGQSAPPPPPATAPSSLSTVSQGEWQIDVEAADSDTEDEFGTSDLDLF
jgi:hypothetical protein